MPEQDPQAHTELASFGEELRREREIRGISLKEIADATKISKRFLEAIERNDHKTLPAPVFTRGFVREYARYVGLSADEIVNRYNFAAAGDDRIEQSGHLERLVQVQSPERSPKKGIPPPYARIDRSVVALAVIVLALGGVFYWAVKHRHFSRAPETEAPTAPRTVAAVARPAEPRPESDSLLLTIDAVDDSWVMLEADGKTTVNERMRKRDHRSVQAKENFKFRTIGNAGGLAITLNDVRLPPIGRDGQVIHDLVIDRHTLEQARKNP